MKIIVTGGAGFIGSHLVDYLISHGHEVIVIDHFRREKLRFLNPAAKIYKVSFGSPEVEEILAKEKPQVIYHLAAQISVTYSIEQPLHDLETNILSALRLLEFSKKLGVEKIIFVSSGGAIYGDHHQIPTPEVMNAKPISPYGIHKQAFEHYLDSARIRGDINSAILRLSNVYGPRQQLTGGEGGVMPIFLNNIFTGKKSVIFGDGSSTRDYLFVHDAVEAFICALDHELDQPVNISTGQETSISQLWQLLQQIHQEGIEKDHLPFRAGEIMRSCLHPAQAQSLLGWRAATSLEQGLRETYDWFKATYYDAQGDNGTI